MGKKAEIRERREKILLLLSRGYSRSDVVKELDITEMTMSRDMQFINETTKRGLFGLAKETLATMYHNCIESINEVQKECWKRYNTRIENNRDLSEWHKHAALELLRKCSVTKFDMFQNAPALMEVDRLKGELNRINSSLDYSRGYRDPVGNFNHDINQGRLPFKKDDLDRYMDKMDHE